MKPQLYIKVRHWEEIAIVYIFLQFVFNENSPHHYTSFLLSIDCYVFYCICAVLQKQTFNTIYFIGFSIIDNFFKLLVLIAFTS